MAEERMLKRTECSREVMVATLRKYVGHDDVTRAWSQMLSDEEVLQTGRTCLQAIVNDAVKRNREGVVHMFALTNVEALPGTPMYVCFELADGTIAGFRRTLREKKP